MKIALLGHGEVGSAFRQTLKAADPRLRIVAHDADPAALSGVYGSGIEGLASADWIVCAVSPASAMEAADQAAAQMREGQVYIDLNGVAPAAKRRAAETVGGAGARYVDMALLGPVFPMGHRTPLVASGDHEAIGADLDRLHFDWRPAAAGAGPGAAAAIGMILNLHARGTEALAVEVLAAAKASGCLPQVAAALSAGEPAWTGRAEAALRSAARYGARHAAEADEGAAMLDALGLSGPLAAQIAGVQRRSAGADPEGDLAALAASLLARARA